MTQSTPLAVLEYRKPVLARGRWFAWRPFWISLSLGLLSIACLRLLPHILRVQEVIGAENHLGKFVGPLQSLRAAAFTVAGEE